jgi:hypothetical protein
VAYVVHHYRPAASNQLDEQLLAYAVRQALVRHRGPVEWVEVPTDVAGLGTNGETGLLGGNIDRSNAEADLVVLSGSDLFEPRKALKSEPLASDWGLSTDIESIHRLRPPLLLLGVGAGNCTGTAFGVYSPRACDEIRLLHAHAFATTINDHAARRQLADIGVPTLCVGSPVAFLTNEPIVSAHEELPLVVALPPARRMRRWRKRWALASAQRFVKRLCEAKVPVVVALHDVGELEATRRWVPSDVELFWTVDVDQLIDRYRNSRGVIGFRAESILLALGLGKPVIPAPLDANGKAVVETFGLQSDAVSPGILGQFRLLQQRTDALLAGDGPLHGRLQASKARLQARFEDFMRETVTALNSQNRGDAPFDQRQAA